MRNVQFKDCDTLKILESNEMITRDEMYKLVYAADTKEDYLVQSYIQKQVLMIHGQNFIATSQPRIEAILYLISHKKDSDLFDMYKKSFKSFMESVQNNYDEVIGFNIIFVFYITIARKLLRESKDLIEDGENVL